MALSAKERKQAQIERERALLAKKPDATYPYLRVPFFERLDADANWSSVEMCFDLLGIDPPIFEDDRGPEDFANDACFSTDEDKVDAFQSSKGSVGRAEVMVDLLLDVAIELSGIINNYKREELRERREELAGADLSDPDARVKALETAAEIAKLEELLQKNVRRTFPVWRVKHL